MKWSDWPIDKICPGDKNYPIGLSKIKNPPKVLFYRGKLDKKYFEKSLAVVGARRITRYGRTVIEKLIPILVSEKVTIISGFMYGTDTEAHQKCLEYKGITVAVLGGGLNVIYPPENEKLYQQILEGNGLVISEYEPDFQPHLWTFPQRNRIVAGLSSLGVLIIEAGEKSGSLITARFAKNQGKKVFAIPGPITSSVSIGANLLIKNHQAKMALSVEDILGKKIESPSLFENNLSSEEKKIVRLLEVEPSTADEIGAQINKNAVETGKTLSMLQLKGIISESIGKYYLK